MDVSRTPNSRDMARLLYEQTRQEVVEESQERVRGAREALHRLSQVRAQRLRRGRETALESATQAARDAATRHTDSIEISGRARVLAGEHTERAARGSAGDDEARAERVAELKQRYQRGELHTPEAAERAAEGLLRQAE
jgi:anti-sigma28 factor (negative regulator of flagellin synthesis)